VKLPRDLSGAELAKLRLRYGYEEIRQSGSHIRVRSKFRGAEHQVTIPAHSPLKVGTLSGILLEIATYLEISKDVLLKPQRGRKPLLVVTAAAVHSLILIAVLAGNIILGDFVRVNFSFVGVAGVLHALHRLGLERVSLLEQLVHTLRIRTFEAGQSL
jgi:predicted RNA binding protein YcfA (HicA-like mRNA interferase family)